MNVLITGGSGLVGQNLTLLLRSSGYTNLSVIDKNQANLELLSRFNPGVKTICADLADDGEWSDAFAGIEVVVILHAQIGGATFEPFERNNLQATRKVLDAIKRHAVPFVVHVSSSVVNSVADDNYTRSKKTQEAMVLACGTPCCVLRPTLMYGWFDPKHFGWLSRFMEKMPVFPVPGNGRYMRQPLYIRDFCRAIAWCIEHRPAGAVYDLVGVDHVTYIDIIKEIRRVKGLRTPIVHLPVWLFALLLRIYALFSRNPPFTADQLKALSAGDDFKGVNTESTFGFKSTSFKAGITETFCDPVYSNQQVARTS
jgi:nucleoside-diphosphate-sugar epimerase